MAPDATAYDTIDPSDDAIIQEVEKYSWFCGGGIKPQTGKDMGVWEASLEDRANCLSRWSLSYLNPLLSLGSRKVLDAGDVGVPSKEDSAEISYEKTKEQWDEQVKIAEAHNKKLMDAHAKKLAKCKTEAAKSKIKPPTLRSPAWQRRLPKALVWAVLSSLSYTTLFLPS